MKQLLAQWSLAEIIAAKIDRRLELLAELHSLDHELVQAGLLLAELPSVTTAKTVQAPAPEIAPVVVKKRRKKRRKGLIHRVCACGVEFDVRSISKRLLCDKCLHAYRQDHMRKFGRYAKKVVEIQQVGTSG